ncbi:MAG: adenylate kinase [Chloroflexota bacterium]
MTITLIGPSGAGKGTQAAKIAHALNWLHLSTGDLFRESLANQSNLGLLAQSYMNQGELVPDEIVQAMMVEWLGKILPEKHIIFDGFPRTQHQAVVLDDLLHDDQRHLEIAIYLKVSDETILKRLPDRLVCQTCQQPYHPTHNPPAISGRCDICRGILVARPDDTPEIIRHRLRTSHRVMDRLVAHYQQTGKLVIVDGEGDIDTVYQAVFLAIEAALQKQPPLATAEEVAQIQALKPDVTPLGPEQSAQASLGLVLLGGPGSGKGTQADQLVQQFDLHHLSTGEIFRGHIQAKTDLGQLAKTYIDQGQLVPNDVTESMVRENLAQLSLNMGFILDGFPRNIAQAEALTEILTALHRHLNGVLYINVRDEEIVQRLSNRRVCRNCETPFHLQFKPPQQDGICDVCQGELYSRDDDNPETIRIRLKTYHAQTAPLIDYYRARGLLFEIDGEGDVRAITDRVTQAVTSLSS